jgi:radical SAM-linked protein
MITRPTRQRKAETVLRLADESLANTGSGEVGLMSLSIGDYEPVNHVLSEFFNKYQDQGLSVSLPSMRTETMNPELAAQVARVRKSGFTFAPEAGSERMRRVINKTNTEEDLMNAVRSTVNAGWRHLKFYFMIGLPTETMEDVEAIARVGERARAEGRKINPAVNVTVSVSTFVPKPHTSFQWDRQIGIEETRKKHVYLRDRLRKKRIAFRYHSAEQSLLEGVFSRGDRRLAPAILEAARAGCRLDAWSEHHNNAVWTPLLEESLAHFGLTPEDYLDERNEKALLPWDHLDAGILKKFLRRDRKASLREATIQDCALKDHCYACGGCDLGDPYLLKDLITGERPIELRPVVRSGLGLPIVDPEVSGTAPDVDPQSSSVERTRMRYQFAKFGRATHISHLDMLEHLQRAIRMAGVPVLTTNGPKPRMKIGFGPACPTGIESEAEYFDVYCQGDIDPKSYAEPLQRWLPQGMSLLHFDTVGWKAAPINSGIISYTYHVKVGAADDALMRALVERFRMSDRFLVEVERKKKRRILDARAHILDVGMVGASLHLKLGFFQGGSLKVREAVACILGLERMWDCQIRKVKMEVGETVNQQTLESPAVDEAAVVLNLVEASARRAQEVVAVQPRPRAESRVVPYAE